jgi:hypothetical protein
MAASLAGAGVSEHLARHPSRCATSRAFIQAVAASASPTAFPQHALLKLSAAKKPASVAVAAGPDTERLDCVESVYFFQRLRSSAARA